MSENIYPNPISSGSQFNTKYGRLMAFSGDLLGGSGLPVIRGIGEIDDDKEIPATPPSGNCKKIYVANITQSGTDDPVVTIFENTIGDIVWTRFASGIYQGTLAGAFRFGKTWLMINNQWLVIDPVFTGRNASFNTVDTEDIVEIRTNNILDEALEDDLLQGYSIEIRTYDCSCSSVGNADLDLPDATIGLPYDFSFDIEGGTPPYTIDGDNTTLPSWMTAEVVDDQVHLSGTPDDTGESLLVQIKLLNCAEATDDTGNYGGFMNVIAAP